MLSAQRVVSVVQGKVVGSPRDDCMICALFSMVEKQLLLHHFTLPYTTRRVHRQSSLEQRNLTGLAVLSCLRRENDRLSANKLHQASKR